MAKLGWYMIDHHVLYKYAYSDRVLLYKITNERLVGIGFQCLPII